jgi:hypothetical protein
LKERVGQFVREGELICTVERTARLEVEVALEEQDIERVQKGCSVELKPRAYVWKTYQAEVSRIAPVVRRETGGDGRPAPRLDAPGTFILYCDVEDSNDLVPGMTGHARISCGKRTIGTILLERGYRLLRPEYWW